MSLEHTTTNPPALPCAPYRVEVRGKVMKPRWQPGAKLKVDPLRPQVAGWGVIVWNKDGTFQAADYVEQTHEFLTVRQYNPDQLVNIPSSLIAAVHTVIGWDEFD
mgnify:CR=1 FL=1